MKNNFSKTGIQSSIKEMLQMIEIFTFDVALKKIL